MGNRTKRAHRAVGVALLTCALLVAPASSAQAKAASTWREVTPRLFSVTTPPAIFRTADGALRVITVQQGPNLRDQHLVMSTVSANGNPSSSHNDLLGRWAEFSAPTVLRDGPGYRMYFGGERTDIATDVFGTTRMVTATSSDGITWLPDLSRSNFTREHVDDVAGVLDGDGRPVLAWATTAGVFTHIGFDPAPGLMEFDSSEACCGFTPNVGYDVPTKSVWLAWRSAEERRNGLFMRHVAGGWKAPEPRYMVARSTNVEIDGPVPLATQQGGAKRLYTAWCERENTGCNTVFVMRPADKKRVQVAEVKRAQHVGLTAGIGGRLWVWWSTNRGIYYTRSNPAVTKFAPPRRIAFLDRARGLWRIEGSGTKNGKLDLLVGFSQGTVAKLYHRRVVLTD